MKIITIKNHSDFTYMSEYYSLISNKINLVMIIIIIMIIIVVFLFLWILIFIKISKTKINLLLNDNNILGINIYYFDK